MKLITVSKPINMKHIRKIYGNGNHLTFLACMVLASDILKTVLKDRTAVTDYILNPTYLPSTATWIHTKSVKPISLIEAINLGLKLLNKSYTNIISLEENVASCVKNIEISLKPIDKNREIVTLVLLIDENMPNNRREYTPNIYDTLRDSNGYVTVDNVNAYIEDEKLKEYLITKMTNKVYAEVEEYLEI